MKSYLLALSFEKRQVPISPFLIWVAWGTPLVYELDADLKPIASPLAVEPLKHLGNVHLGDATRAKESQMKAKAYRPHLHGCAGHEFIYVNSVEMCLD